MALLRPHLQLYQSPKQLQQGTMKVLNYGSPNSCGIDVTDNKTNEDSTIKSVFFKPFKQEMDDKFHREDERLRTFTLWPLDFIEKELLARSGMYYTREEDKVKCYFCEVEIGKWEPTDHPVHEHMRWSPNCPLLLRRTTNNVPINAEELDRILPAISYDVCGANEALINEIQTEGAIGSYGLNNSQCGSNNNGRPFYPEYPEYAVEEARKRSFSEWPRHMKQRPDQLAAAGYFYTGKGDRVICFSCGGGLKDWDEHDEPWEQHALWLKNCRYLKLIKGQSYIDSVLAKFNNAVAGNGSEPAATAATNGGDELSGGITTQETTEAAEAVEPIAALFNDEASNKDKDTIEKVKVTTPTTPTTPTTECCLQHNGFLKCDNMSIAPAQQSATVTVANAAYDLTAATERRSNNTTIPEEKLCKICYASEYNTAFLPCGHVVACAKCASSVTKCPLCRKPFTDIMRVYFS